MNTFSRVKVGITRNFFSVFIILVVSNSHGFASQQTSYRDIKILQSDDQGMTIEFVPEFTPKKISANGKLYTNYNFFGAVSTGLKNQGTPHLNYRSLPIGLPTENGNTVQILVADYEDISGVNVPPVPNFMLDKQGFISSPVYKEKVEVFAQNQFYPPTIVELTDVGHARSSVIGNVKIFPVQYNPAQEIVRKYKRIVVHIIFGIGRRSSGKVVENSLLKNTILNYNVARQWSVEPPRLSNVTANSVLATGEWYRVEIKEDGIYRIDAKFLTDAGINLLQIDPETIKIYGNGGFELPQDITASRPDDLIENAIFVQETGGKFTSNDYILFYAKGVRGWNYNPSTKSLSHYIHHYTETNYYWLTFGGQPGKRMQPLPSLTLSNFSSPKSFTGKLFLEEEKNKTPVNSGLEWFGQFFNAKAPSIVYTNKLDGLISSEPITYRFVFLARSDNFTQFRVEDNGTLLGAVTISPVDLGSIITNYANKSGVATFQRSGNLPDSRSLVKITYVPNSDVAEGYLDWMEIFYKRDFNAVNDLLNFTSPDTAAIIQYNLGNFSSSNIVTFDVSDFANIKLITNPSISGGGLTFQAQQRAGTVSEYYAVGSNGFKTPVAIKKMGNSNLHGITDGADFVIISHNDFLSEAQRLKAQRERPTDDFLKTLVVDVQDVYNEFSGGLLDPTAIRDFMKSSYDHWTTKPRYLLLLGDGDYDYKNVITNDKNWIPPYESYETLYQIDSYCSDDYYGLIVGNDARVDLAIGRLPVRTQDEARIVVDKIISYESNPALDPWKIRITFVADDGLTSTGDDGSLHTGQAEQLAQQYTPEEFEKKKIYIVEYPIINTALGRRKPSANKAIVDQINEGTLIINWTGHGNPEVWAYEHVFERETTLPQLQNRNRLTFVGAATCDFARYDHPTEQSSAELLLVKDGGGAIGVMSSSRAVFSFDNAEFNNAFFAYLLNRESSRKLTRIGDALFLTKQAHFSINDIKFNLLGDPSMRLSVPISRAALDSINGKSTQNLAQLKALSKVNVKGSIRKPDGTLWTDFNGTVLVTMFDSKKEIPVPEWYNFSFVVPGGIIYKGENTVTNGEFAATFFVPKDISYENNRGRAALYFANQNSDGAGYNENFLVGGTDTTAVNDTQGPQITIYFDSRNFRAGDIVNENPLLIVDLFDEHGINTSGTGIGHRLEARLDNATQSIDVTDFYKGKTDSFQEGTIEYHFSNLSPSRHTLSVKAWDVFNNSATKETFFEVASSSQLSISNVFNYPNPFNRSTTFTFQHNQSLPIDVEIKIYTVTGRLIETIEQPGITSRFVQISWSGTDRDGDQLANGVYLYKVIAHTQDGRFTSESLGKLMVLK